MVQIHQLPALEDNYIYLLENGAEALVIDPGESKPVLDFLSRSNLNLTHILNTHHHLDHVGGNEDLVHKTGARVIGFLEDRHRIPLISQTVQDNETIVLLDLSFDVLYIPGHTTGHIAFYVSDLKALFCGDTLFSLGCGRLFEGTPEQMWASLQRLCALPNDTLVFCAHEYTLQNARFAQSLEPDTPSLNLHIEKIVLKRRQNQPTVPSLLKDEKRYNPFLKANSAQFFAHLRQLKDTFS